VIKKLTYPFLVVLGALVACIIIVSNFVSYVKAFRKRFKTRPGTLCVSSYPALFSYKITDRKVAFVGLHETRIDDIVIVLANTIAYEVDHSYNVGFMSVEDRRYDNYVTVMIASGDIVTIRSNTFDDMPRVTSRKGGKVAKTC